MTGQTWIAITNVISMSDRADRMATAMKIQQERIKQLNERMIRLETALEIGMARPAAERLELGRVGKR